jgi:hypothetical protein
MIQLQRLSAAMVVTVALVSIWPVVPADALPATESVDARLRLDWQAGTSRGGRPVIAGYDYNDYVRSAGDVRLLVEAVDGSGGTVSRDMGFVPGVVPLRDRAYFEVPVRHPGATYRVSIVAYEWRDCGGGGGGM